MSKTYIHNYAIGCGSHPDGSRGVDIRLNEESILLSADASRDFAELLLTAVSHLEETEDESDE